MDNAGDKWLPRILARLRVGEERKCWIWSGSPTGQGYGQVMVAGRTRMVHRVIFEVVHGPIEAGYEIDHLCRFRLCSFPGHLEQVTRKENLNRRRAWGTVGVEDYVEQMKIIQTGSSLGDNALSDYISSLRSQQERARQTVSRDIEIERYQLMNSPYDYEYPKPLRDELLEEAGYLWKEGLQ